MARKPVREAEASLPQALSLQGAHGCQISDPSHTFLSLTCSSQGVTWCSSRLISSPNLAVDNNQVYEPVATSSPCLTLLTCKMGTLALSSASGCVSSGGSRNGPQSAALLHSLLSKLTQTIGPAR